MEVRAEPRVCVARTLFDLQPLWHTNTRGEFKDMSFVHESCLCIPCVFFRPKTLEFTAFDFKDDSASRSYSIGAVKPPRRNAGSVLCVSTSLALIEAMWFILFWSLALVRTPGPFPPLPRFTL